MNESVTPVPPVIFVIWRAVGNTSNSYTRQSSFGSDEVPFVFLRLDSRAAG